MALERDFQRNLIKEIEARYPGCYVLKNDAGYKGSIPDLLVLHNDHWAMLEVKKDKAALKKSLKKQPNQAYHVEKLNGMSFATFIFPENKEDVLNELDRRFNSQG